MSLGDLWSRTLVYFGIAEEDDDFFEDEESLAAEESLELSYRDRPNVRRLTPRRRSQEFDDWTESSEAERALRRAGVQAVERVDLCTRCNAELFFSHRRSGRQRGAQGVIGAVAG